MTTPKKEIKFKLVDTDYKYDYGANYRLQLVNLSIGKNKFSLVDLYLQQYTWESFVTLKEFLVECLRSEFSIRFQIVGAKFQFQVFALRVELGTPIADLELTLFKYDKVEQREKWEEEVMNSFGEADDFLKE